MGYCNNNNTIYTYMSNAISFLYNKQYVLRVALQHTFNIPFWRLRSIIILWRFMYFFIGYVTLSGLRYFMLLLMYRWKWLDFDLEMFKCFLFIFIIYFGYLWSLIAWYFWFMTNLNANTIRVLSTIISLRYTT